MPGARDFRRVCCAAYVVRHDDEAVRKVGIHWAAEQVRDLLDNEVAGVHFYTLNRSRASEEICQILGLRSYRDVNGVMARVQENWVSTRVFFRFRSGAIFAGRSPDVAELLVGLGHARRRFRTLLIRSTTCETHFDNSYSIVWSVLDGATGTELRNRGMPADACPERWILQNPDQLVRLQEAYCEAGSDIIYSGTFGANRYRLRRFGIQENVTRMNRQLAEISRRAAGHGWVFGDMAPSGAFIEPLGDIGFEAAVESCKEQVQGLIDGGVDGFVVETMVDIQEARAAIIAIRELSDLPIIASITLDKNGRCLTGANLLTAMVTLQSLGVDAVGCNCSTGPADMIGHLRSVKPYATVPLLAKPNAGMPRATGNGTEFDIDAEEFASFVRELVRRGANLLGGCCGTNPRYIRGLKAEAAKCTPVPVEVDAVGAVTSANSTVLLDPRGPLTIVGERINPTGKAKLAEDLKEGRLEMVRRFAVEQAEHGARIAGRQCECPRGKRSGDDAGVCTHVG